MNSEDPYKKFRHKKDEKTRKTSIFGSWRPGTPPITPKTPIWPKPAIALFARFRFRKGILPGFPSFLGHFLGLLHLHFWGFWGGRRGGRGGRGSPGSLLEVWGSVLDDFLDVWIFGIHPQNNQDKKNIVYITSKITRALRIRHFQIICYQNERVKNLNLFSSLLISY